ncbi:Ig-like domain repeat protein [Spirillospora sp. NPDC052269]
MTVGWDGPSEGGANGVGRRRRARWRGAVAVLTAAVGAAWGLVPVGTASAGTVPPTHLAYSTGTNTQGMLGNGTTTNRNTLGAVLLPEGLKVKQVSSGYYHTLVLTPEDRVWSWGLNGNGQLGDGTTTRRLTPVEVHLPDGVRVTQVAGGGSHSLAVTTEHRVLAWGTNYYGAQGDGTTTDRPLPHYVHLPEHIAFSQVAGDGGHSLALTTDGRVWGWGRNAQGQLGDGTNTDRLTPVEMALPAGVHVTQVAAGGSHSLLLASDGRVWATGYNYDGELGDGTTTNRNRPVEVHLPSGVHITQIDGGGTTSVALASDGRGLSWGGGSGGMVGDGATGNRLTPVEVLLPPGVRLSQIETGHWHSVALTTDGRVLGWGTNNAGQLGDGTNTARPTPVFMPLPAQRAATQITAGHSFSVVLAEAAATRTSLAAHPTYAGPGEDVTLTAHVTCNLGTPTGLVAFYDGDREIGTAPVDEDGVATLTVSDLEEGRHHITARYEGDGECPPSESEPVTVAISTQPAHASLHLDKQFAGFVKPDKRHTKHAKARSWAHSRHNARMSVPDTAQTSEKGAAVQTSIWGGTAGLSAWREHDAIRYRFIVTNTGDLPINAITIHDSRTGTISCSTGTLQPGQTATCYGIHKVTDKERSRGHVDNTATATGHTEDGDTVTSNKAELRVDITYA